MKKFELYFSYFLFSVSFILIGAILHGLYYYPELTSVSKYKCNHIEEISYLKNKISKLDKNNQELLKSNSNLENEIKIISAITPPSEKKVIELIRQTPSVINQGIEPSQLKTLIKSVLSYLGEKDKKWIDLLMLTSQAESGLGKHVKQIKGPAVGIFQVEPFTEKEVWKHFINRQPKLKEKINSLRYSAKLGRHEMEYNIAYSIAITYSIYKWRKVNPSGMTTVDLVKTHKKKFNSMKGAATVQKTFVKIHGTNII